MAEFELNTLRVSETKNLALFQVTSGGQFRTNRVDRGVVSNEETVFRQSDAAG